jgi:hypothetical protein
MCLYVVCVGVCLYVCVRVRECKEGKSFADGNEIAFFYGTSRFIYNLYETLPLNLSYFHKLKLIGIIQTTVTFLYVLHLLLQVADG